MKEDIVKLAIRTLLGVSVFFIAIALADGQTSKTTVSTQESGVASLQRRVTALEQEVRSLKLELASLRAQIDKNSSTKTGVSAVRESKSDSSRPSESEIRACVSAEGTPAGSTYGGVYGEIVRLQFGTPSTSQGGMLEVGMGAPQGTNIFPVKVYFSGGYTFDFWVFKDSFGALKCERM